MLQKGMQPADYGLLYDRFQASVSRYDCGRFCAPLNNGEPVCCTTGHAIPVVDKTEYALLKTRTDLWHKFKPTDATSRKIVAELHASCTAIECKGARSCERDNRTLACRAFPFYPYITKDDRIVGLGTYWIFEDRCWLMSNMQVVERDFIGEFIAAYEFVFARDPEERAVMRNHSATHRRVFSRQNRIIPLIGREGGFLKVMPKTGEIRPARFEEFSKIGPYRSERAYKAAVKEAGGTLPEQSPISAVAAE
jgi:hypothetical protein